MGFLFPKPPPPPPPIIPPPIIPPPPLPDLQSPAIIEAGKTKVAALAAQQGRASTILTDPNAPGRNPDLYGSNKLG